MFAFPSQTLLRIWLVLRERRHRTLADEILEATADHALELLATTLADIHEGEDRRRLHS